MNISKRKSTIIFVLSYFLTVNLAVSDVWDPLDDLGTSTTNILSVNASPQTHGPHTLGSGDTNDWFEVYLEEGIPYQLESTGESDIKAFLYADASGTTLEKVDDQGGEGDNFMLRYVPNTTGTYYLNVQTFPVGYSGSYTLQFGYYSADAWDPVDNAATNGTLLTMGEAAKVHGSHVLDGYDEYDWYQINLSSGVVYRFESLGDDDIVAELYDNPELNFIWDDDDGGHDLNFQLDYEPVESDIYYLKIGKFQPEVDYDLLYYIPENDSDADQLLDSWEQQYYGDLSAEPNDLIDDSDPFTTLEEYIAGTDPTNAASFFAVTNGWAGNFVVKWSSVTNREYQVFHAESLTNSFVPLGLPIEYPINSYTDTTHNAESSGFYKVEVQLK